MHQHPKLPYDFTALAPYISEKTMRYHYAKHHKGYFDKLNTLVTGTEHENKSLVDLITTTDGAIFNNAAQAWNHILYWDSMSPTFDQSPSGDCLDLIIRDFGSVDKLKADFTQAALNTFGSGWAWLVLHQGKLQIMSTQNAHNPAENPDFIPLLACDVWEHAYYLDTQNNRASYLDHFWKVCNWKNVEKILI